MIWNQRSSGTVVERWNVTSLVTLFTVTELLTLLKVRSARLRPGNRYWDWIQPLVPGVPKTNSIVRVKEYFTSHRVTFVPSAHFALGRVWNVQLLWSALSDHADPD